MFCLISGDAGNAGVAFATPEGRKNEENVKKIYTAGKHMKDKTLLRLRVVLIDNALFWFNFAND